MEKYGGNRDHEELKSFVSKSKSQGDATKQATEEKVPEDQQAEDKEEDKDVSWH